MSTRRRRRHRRRYDGAFWSGALTLCSVGALLAAICVCAGAHP
ncbi:hypothetical protein [Streptomyces sp. NPDC102360]